METITEIIFYSRDRKFECDLTPLLWANPYANGKYMSQQRALKSEKGHHDLGCTSHTAASTSRKAICFSPEQPCPRRWKAETQLSSFVTSAGRLRLPVPSRWEPGGPAGVQGPQPAGDSRELHGTTSACLEGRGLYPTPAPLSLKPRLLLASSLPRGTRSFLNC